MNPDTAHTPPDTEVAPMRVAWQLVSPTEAERILAGNQNNRAVRDNAIARYSADMEGGHWTPSNDLICIDPDGRMLNGQHRMLAVVRSGCTVGFWIARNMPAEAYASMDRGVGRTFADLLRSEGEQVNTTQLAATLTRAAGYERGLGIKGVWGTQQPDIKDSDRNGYLLRHPEIRRSVAEFGRQSYAKETGGCPPSVLALAHHLIEQSAGPEAADAFMRQLVTQDCEPVTGTIRSAIRSVGSYAGRSAHDRHLAVVLWAFNHWGAGREKSIVRIALDFRNRVPQIASRVTR